MFLVTPRLLLRPPWPEDAAMIAASVTQAVARMTGSLPWPYGRDDAAAWLAAQAQVPAIAESSAVIIERQANGFAGVIGFSRNKLNGVPEIGYWLPESAHGRGIATEAGRAWIDLAFGLLRLPELWAGHFADNPASATVLMKLGFRATGEVVDYPCTARGTSVPSPTYRITRADWQTANTP